MQKPNINQKVWNLLSKDVSIQKDLNRGIINNRALAKYLIKQSLHGASLDSVISAIRRYDSEKIYNENSKALQKVFKSSVISTKNNIASIKLKASAEEHFEELYKKKMHKVGIFRVIKASRFIKVIVNSDDLESFLEFFPRDKVDSVKDDMSEISLLIDANAEQTKGVVSRIVNEISINDINIWDVIICLPEFRVFVNKTDLLKAHEVILGLFEGEE